MRTPAPEDVPIPIRHARSWRIVPTVVRGVARRTVVERRGFRSRLLRDVWIDVKRFGAPNVRMIELTSIRGIRNVRVDGPVVRHGPLVLCALATLLECDRIFEMGTFAGETSWLLAHNVPKALIYTLDPHPRQGGPAGYAGTPEEARVTELRGDPTDFDFSPYSGSIDLVRVDMGHECRHVGAATGAAFGMLSELGSIVWDDYTHCPSVYTYLNALAPSLERPIFHISGTRLAFYSRWDIVVD